MKWIWQTRQTRNGRTDGRTKIVTSWAPVGAKKDFSNHLLLANKVLWPWERQKCRKCQKEVMHSHHCLKTISFNSDSFIPGSEIRGICSSLHQQKVLCIFLYCQLKFSLTCPDCIFVSNTGSCLVLLATPALCSGFF